MAASCLCEFVEVVMAEPWAERSPFRRPVRTTIPKANPNSPRSPLSSLRQVNSTLPALARKAALLTLSIFLFIHLHETGRPS
jgi:hypothetical protein